MADLSLQNHAPPPELCVVRLSAIGDTCHTLPVVRAIQDAWPDTRITWIIGKVEHGLMRGLEGVEFAVLDKKAGLAGYRALRRQLSGRRFPLLLHMHASARANIASLMASADVRVGFDRTRARNGQWLLSNRRVAARTRLHVMDGLFDFAEALGIARGEPRWDLPLSDDDRRFAAQVLDAERPALVISPCTVQRFRNYRNWRAEWYAEVADYAAERYGADIVLTGGTTEIEQAYSDRITSLMKTTPRNLIGQTTLKQFVAILERATVVLCPDSGPAHMATAVRTPVVGLYATTNPLRAGPYLSQHLVVNKYPEAVRNAFGREADEVRWGTRVRDEDAMSLIRPADVNEKLDLAFAERGVAQVT